MKGVIILGLIVVVGGYVIYKNYTTKGKWLIEFQQRVYETQQRQALEGYLQGLERQYGIELGV